MTTNYIPESNFDKARKAKTCTTCKHWIKEYMHRGETCDNIKVIDMMDSIAGVVFEPPANFGCSLWEGKK